MTDRYTFEVPAFEVTFVADRLRRERNDLVGELSVRCGLPGAQTVNGILSTSDFNFSSLSSRQARAKHLKERARTNGELDWYGLLENFCGQVFSAERTGDPDIDLRSVERPAPNDDLFVEGLVLPRRHPSILFGDGGSAKSYIALFIAGQLARRGMAVGFADWELCGEDHRDRFERVFGSEMPEIRYQSCARPLSNEVDRLRRWQRERKLDYIILDSIAPACDGRPEEAEVAGRYFRALREIGCGTLNIAHINKSDSGDKKPFGSSFWHNLARSTWFCEAAEPAGDGTLRVGLFNRKSNLGPLRQAISFALTFTSDRTTFRRADVVDTPEFAKRMTVRQQLRAILSRGARTLEDIANQTEVDAETIKRTMRRHKTDFVALDGGRIGLTEKFA